MLTRGVLGVEHAFFVPVLVIIHRSCAISRKYSTEGILLSPFIKDVERLEYVGDEKAFDYIQAKKTLAMLHRTRKDGSSNSVTTTYQRQDAHLHP